VFEGERVTNNLLKKTVGNCYLNVPQPPIGKKVQLEGRSRTSKKLFLATKDRCRRWCVKIASGGSVRCGPAGLTGPSPRAGGRLASPPRAAAQIAGLGKKKSPVIHVPWAAPPCPPPGAPLADEDPGWVDEDGGSSTTGNFYSVFY